jgi:hypothetical protein
MQFTRELRHTGGIQLLVAAVILLFLLTALFQQLNKFPNGIYALSLILISILSIHLSRNDKRFVTGITEKPWRLYFSEYFIFSVPVAILILLSGSWYLFVPYTILLVLISKIDHKKRENKISFNYSFIPKDYFEWISGSRKNLYPIIILYCIGLAASFNLFVIPIIFFLLLGILSSFYEECESWQLLEIQELSAKKFIRQKIIRHFRLFLIATSPLSILYLFFHPSYWYVILILYVLSLIIHSFCILCKYSMYEPDKLLTENRIWVSIAIMSYLIPFLVPLPLIMCFRFYNRSINNLDNYLNAYN